MEKRIALLGSTGSIGRQTLEVIESLGPDYRVVGLAAGSNHKLFAEQVRKFKPQLAALADAGAADILARELGPDFCPLETGPEGQIAVACLPAADLVVLAQVGFSGFEPLVAALEAGKTVALSNKESLVTGGEILERRGLLDRTRILPVDSEHSAIWQCWGDNPADKVRRVFLTASGGPFYGFSRAQLERVTPAEALKHPNWQMGGKISIDSATMMNKGLEVLEARWLFGLDLERVETVVHRQSIIHSMVEFIDGSVLAQMGLPDMRLPIQYAITYPERRPGRVGQFNPFGQTLTFEKPDRENFPCLDLAYRAGRAGGTMPACLNGANEAAVAAFLAGSIGFTAIPEVISRVMQHHSVKHNPTVAEIIETDAWARREADIIITGQTGGVF